MVCQSLSCLVMIRPARTLTSWPSAHLWSHHHPHISTLHEKTISPMTGTSNPHLSLVGGRPPCAKRRTAFCLPSIMALYTTHGMLHLKNFQHPKLLAPWYIVVLSKCVPLPHQISTPRYELPSWFFIFTLATGLLNIACWGTGFCALNMMHYDKASLRHELAKLTPGSSMAR